MYQLQTDHSILVKKICFGPHRALLLRPKKVRPLGEEKPAGVLWIHGGGYISGMKEMVLFTRGADLVRKFRVVVLSPAYRLAQQSPYPAAIEDCYDALLYMKEHADALGIRDDQIMVGGESAGGGLCAALCMLARDRGEVNIAYQMPLYPMLDDRDTDSSRNNHGITWGTRRNHLGWRLYLGKHAGGEASPYAAAARQKDYSGLPPAYTFVGSREPFYCETMAFIDNLKKAGVEASVDVYPYKYHGIDITFPEMEISKEIVRNFDRQFAYAQTHFFNSQKEIKH